MWSQPQAILLGLGVAFLIPCGGVPAEVGAIIPSVLYFGIWASTHGLGNTSDLGWMALKLSVWTGLAVAIANACGGGRGSKAKTF
jgi:hypothetical protein